MHYVTWELQAFALTAAKIQTVFQLVVVGAFVNVLAVAQTIAKKAANKLTGRRDIKPRVHIMLNERNRRRIQANKSPKIPFVFMLKRPC